MTTCVPCRMKGALALLALAACAHGGAQAQTVVYKCVDDSGRVEFTDTSKRGCKALDLPGFVAAAPARKATGTRQGGPALSAASPSNFPRVDSAQQKARDDDRREILNDELRNEEKKLADLKREFNNGEPERVGGEKNYAKYLARVAQMREDISRSERNVEALRREIGNLK